jgi:hypothetical protein
VPDDDSSEDDRGAFEVEPIDRGGARKVSGPLADELGDVPANETLSAIVKVSEAGYVPEAADQRARISDTLFTANVRRDLLGALEDDPRVVSVELSERLGLID